MFRVNHLCLQKEQGTLEVGLKHTNNPIIVQAVLNINEDEELMKAVLALEPIAIRIAMAKAR